MSARFIKKSGGRLEAVRRGSPPPAPAGFKQSKVDKYIYEPLLASCENREERERINPVCGCRRGETYLYCNRFNYNVIAQQCIKCEFGGAYE